MIQCSQHENRRDDVVFYVIDDHPVIGFGMIQLLSLRPTWRMAGVSSAIEDGLKQVLALRPHVVFMDLLFPDSSGMSHLLTMRDEAPWTTRVVYTVQPVQLYAAACLRAGAGAYLHKSASIRTIVAGVESALAGRAWAGEGAWVEAPARRTAHALTERQLEVFQFIGQGRSTHEIAQLLCRSVKTIETHRHRIAQKLGAKSSSDLMRLAMQHCEEVGVRPAASTSPGEPPNAPNPHP